MNQRQINGAGRFGKEFPALSNKRHLSAFFIIQASIEKGQ